MTATEPVITNPGRPGEFNWMGYNWTTRNGGTGSPGLAGWSRDNVIKPQDPLGPLKLRLTNPTGSQPIGAEIRSTRRGFGYGTFVCVIEKDNWQDMHIATVFGGMFSYDWNSPPGYQEMDMCETSGWGRTNRPVETGHVLWVDANRGTFKKEQHDAPQGVRFQTHRCTWEPGKVTFESFDGVGFGGRLRKRTVFTEQVHTPKTEAIVFNLWVFNTSNRSPKTSIKSEEVTLRYFSFTPRGTPASPPPSSIDSAAPAPGTETPSPPTPAPAPVAPEALVVSSTFPIQGTNSTHGTDSLVLYRPDHGATTGNAKNSYEVAIVGGVVTEVRDFSDPMPIPKNGAVLSGRGKAREWLIRMAPRGATLQLPE